MNINRKTKKELNIWLKILLIMMCIILGTILIALIFNPHEGDFINIRIASILVKIIAIVTVIIFTKYIDKKALTFLGLKDVKSNSKLLMIGCIITLVQFIFVITIGLVFNITTCESINTEPSSVLIGTAIFFVHCIFVALSEEMLFRGYIFGNLLTKMSEKKALVISSIIFLSVHYSTMGDILSYIDILLMGFIFAYVYVLSHSLYLSMGIHFLTDFLQYMFMVDIPQNPFYFIQFKLSHNIFIGTFNLGPEIELPFIISDILILLCIFGYKRLKLNPKSQRI